MKAPYYPIWMLIPPVMVVFVLAILPTSILLCPLHARIFTPQLETYVIDTYVKLLLGDEKERQMSLLSSEMFVRGLVKTCTQWCPSRAVDSQVRLLMGMESFAMTSIPPATKKTAMLHDATAIFKTIKSSDYTTALQACYTIGALTFSTSSITNSHQNLSADIFTFFERLRTPSATSSSSSSEIALYACGATSVLKFASTHNSNMHDPSLHDTALIAIGTLSRNIHHASFLLEIQSMDILTTSLETLNAQHGTSHAQLATLHVKTLARTFQNIKHVGALQAVLTCMRKFSNVSALIESACSGLGVLAFRDQRFQYQMRFGDANTRVTQLLVDVMRANSNHAGILMAAAGVLWTVWTIPVELKGTEDQDDVWAAIDALLQLIVPARLNEPEGPALMNNFFGALFMLSQNAIPAHSLRVRRMKFDPETHPALYRRIGREMLRLLSESLDMASATACTVACDYISTFGVVTGGDEMEMIKSIQTKFKQHKEVQEKCGVILLRGKPSLPGSAPTPL